jgi:uncharacterized protein YjbJ (UPF0337 family)
MTDENQQDQSNADKAVDKAQEKTGDQDSKANQAVDKAQEKGAAKKAEEKIKDKFGKGSK